jgi:hypothetical protein
MDNRKKLKVDLVARMGLQYLIGLNARKKNRNKVLIQKEYSKYIN